MRSSCRVRFTVTSEIVVTAACLRADCVWNFETVYRILSTFFELLVVLKGPSFFLHNTSIHTRVHTLNNQFSTRNTICTLSCHQTAVRKSCNGRHSLFSHPLHGPYQTNRSKDVGLLRFECTQSHYLTTTSSCMVRNSN